MSQEWYVYQNEKQEGPYTWEELWKRARSGSLRGEDRVWTEGMGDWVPASEVTGLTGIPASATLPPPPPPIGAEARPAASFAPTAGADGATPKKGRIGLWIGAAAGAVVFLAVAGGAAYWLFLRYQGLPASPEETAVPPATATPTMVSRDQSDGEEGTQEAVADRETPAEQVVPESSAEPTGAADGQPTKARPTIEATVEATTEIATEEPPPESGAETPDAGEGDQQDLPSPTAVVDEFLRVTLGTVPGATVDYDRARVLMTVAYAAEFDSPAFVPLTYGIQDGPTSYEIAAEEISGSTATVVVLGYWEADLGRQWRFVLEEEAGLWRVANIEVLEASEPVDPDEAQSPFWELNPVLEEFTVYPHGGWKLVVAFDQPGEDIGVDFRIEYWRKGDDSLAYTQESSGVVPADRVRLTLDSDWTGYDLSELGFGPGEHRVVAYIDGVEIGSGEFTVE